MTQTGMTHLPLLIRTYGIFPIAQEIKYLGIFFFLFQHGNVTCAQWNDRYVDCTQ